MVLSKVLIFLAVKALDHQIPLCVTLIFSITTLHLPNCVIVVLLYVLSVVVSFVVTNVSSVVLGNHFLNILNGIILPSQPRSTLYDTLIVACLDNVFCFATIAAWFELKLIKFIFTILMPGSCSWMTHTGLGPSEDCLKVVDLATVVAPLTICQESSWFMLLSAVLAFLFGDYHVTCILFCPLSPFSWCVIASKVLDSHRLLITAVWTLWFSSPFAHAKIVSLGIVTSSQHFVSSLITSANISWLFKPWMNCLSGICLLLYICIQPLFSLACLSTLQHSSAPICRIVAILSFH